MSESESGTPPDAGLETDNRFPSGEWTGFFLQKIVPGKSWMELRLTFKKGLMAGDGRDWVGKFVFKGRYDVETGKCWWTKSYLGKHSIAYQGFNEGKGIWGVWEWEKFDRGGFHIWPIAMGDPTVIKLAVEAELPAESEATSEVLEEVPVGVS